MISQETTSLTRPSLRQQLKHYLPKSFLLWHKRRKWEPIRQRYAALSVKDAFTNIYSNKLWGGSEGEEFFSGTGSTERFSVPYVDWLTQFIGAHGIKTVVDLGCGDFQVGRRIRSANTAINYIGIDVVSDLIEYNRSRFGGDHVEFRCANIIEDNLPDGDLCLIRQVLQHLSNAQILRVLANCAKYHYLLVTESVSMGRIVRPNLDMPHGPDVRASDRSGLFLDLPPFNLLTQTVLELPDPTYNLIIRTMLVNGPKH
jgi:SAM-dependent methyltransferase